MSVNPSKCSMITFYRPKSPAEYQYLISGIQIPKVKKTKDLDVYFDSDKSFSSYIDRICSKASKMIGFIARFSRGINNPVALRSLYCALVRKLLEYASPVWSP
ncbi:uncharacterized protein LOC128998891 [Macrosteles quadrilineatus]|uniref:uncharacterized protein LOC128998891 n=1 Tax=Macrosteles quadrilineatus TaxID=74068 RepID=UPI0023E2AEE8|nr:uncharacterized protein LOC128998891 [Macrosteles quadrilineatus]